VEKKTFAAVVIVIIVAVAIIIVGIGNIINLFQRAIPPDVEIISKSYREGFEGFDYVIYVDATVYNRGGSGTVTVWAELTQGSDSWKKTQTVHLEAKESKDLTFTFREVSFWSIEGGGTYRVWVEY